MVTDKPPTEEYRTIQVVIRPNGDREKCPLETVPPELRMAIIDRLPDIVTLINLLVASRVYKSDWDWSHGRQVFDILEREVGRDVLQLAVISEAALKVSHDHEKHILSFIGRLLRGMRRIPRIMAKNLALRISMEHQAIKYFTYAYFRRCFRRLRIAGAPAGFVAPPTKQELERCYRGFYLHKTAVNLFYHDGYPKKLVNSYSMRRLATHFWGAFSHEEQHQALLLYGFIDSYIDKSKAIESQW
jgi:hypothetical protein